MTGYDKTVAKGDKKTFNLSDGDNFQIYYKHPWGSTTVPDYLGAVSRDGNSGWISVTFQQPGQADVNWYESGLKVGNKSFGSAELKHWPKAPSVKGCQNQSWGAICSGSGSSASVTFKSQSA